MNNPSDLIIKRYYWWAFALVLIVALFTHLDTIPLKFEEPRRGVVALEMLFSGDYISPTINGEPYYNKPPVYNWILVGLFKSLGSYEDWVLRIPTVICFVLLAWAHYHVTRKRLGHDIAILASLFFLTSTDLLFYFSFQGEIDMFYCLIVYLQVIAILGYFEKEDYLRLFVCSYILAAVGVLTKGLPSIAFQGITLLAVFIYHKRFRYLFHYSHFIGFGVFVLLVGGYFFTYHQQQDAFPFITRLISESSNRTVVEKSFIESIQHLFSFPLILLDILAPWLIIAPLFLNYSIFSRLKTNRWVGYCVLFIASNIIIYWISPGTRDRYLYMFVPFFTTLFAYIVHYRLASMGVPRLANGLFVFLQIVFLIAMPVLPFVQPVSTVSHIGIVVTLLALAFSVLLYLYFRANQQRIFIFILFILVARIGFNFIVMPLRLQDELKDNYEHHVTKVLEIAEGKNVYFFGEKQEFAGKLPLCEETIDYKQLRYYPFQLSYYMEKHTQSIFQYSNQLTSGNLYLAEKSYFDSQVKTAQLLYSFDVKLRGFSFVLFRYP